MKNRKETFGRALEALKNGHEIRRAAWPVHTKISLVKGYLNQKGAEQTIDDGRTQSSLKLLTVRGINISLFTDSELQGYEMVLPRITCTIDKFIVNPAWVPETEDILASDWIVIWGETMSDNDFHFDKAVNSNAITGIENIHAAVQNGNMPLSDYIASCQENHPHRKITESDFTTTDNAKKSLH